MDCNSIKKLNHLDVGQSATVKGFARTNSLAQKDGEEEAILCRLIEMGVISGVKIKICHKAPFGGSPMAIAVHNNLVGLGRKESELILVDEEK